MSVAKQINLMENIIKSYENCDSECNNHQLYDITLEDFKKVLKEKIELETQFRKLNKQYLDLKKDYNELKARNTYLEHEYEYMKKSFINLRNDNHQDDIKSKYERVREYN